MLNLNIILLNNIGFTFSRNNFYFPLWILVIIKKKIQVGSLTQKCFFKRNLLAVFVFCELGIKPMKRFYSNLACCAKISPDHFSFLSYFISMLFMSRSPLKNNEKFIFLKIGCYEPAYIGLMNTYLLKIKKIKQQTTTVTFIKLTKNFPLTAFL